MGALAILREQFIWNQIAKWGQPYWNIDFKVVFRTIKIITMIRNDENKLSELKLGYINQCLIIEKILVFRATVIFYCHLYAFFTCLDITVHDSWFVFCAFWNYPGKVKWSCKSEIPQHHSKEEIWPVPFCLQKSRLRFSFFGSFFLRPDLFLTLS